MQVGGRLAGGGGGGPALRRAPGLQAATPVALPCALRPSESGIYAVPSLPLPKVA